MNEFNDFSVIGCFALWWCCMDLLDRSPWLPLMGKYLLIIASPLFTASYFFSFDLTFLNLIFYYSGAFLVVVGGLQFIFKPKDVPTSLNAREIYSGDVETASNLERSPGDDFLGLCNDKVKNAYFLNRWEFIFSGLTLLVIGIVVHIAMLTPMLSFLTKP